MDQKSDKIKVVYNNKRATFDYELLERLEAGIALTGTEIKSVRANNVSLQQSYVQARGDELWLLEANISPYEHGNRENHEPKRPRKLLLHRREINRILSNMTQKGLTIVPTRLYLKGGRAKVEIALATGKREYDKRQTLRERQDKREADRAMYSRSER